MDDSITKNKKRRLDRSPDVETRPFGKLRLLHRQGAIS